MNLETESALAAALSDLPARRWEFQELGYVPRDFVQRLKDAGVFRTSTPRKFGGDPMAPADFLRLVERISKVDGSTGWVASFGSALTFLAALPVETQEQIYANGPDVVFAGGLFPVQPVPETPAGYRVKGRWKYVSGVMGADYVGVGIPGPPQGAPRWAVLKSEQVSVVQEWDVNGMRASGSFDVVVDGVDVAHDWTFLRDGCAQIDEPLFRYPALLYQAQVHAAVALGVAMAALDYVEEAGGSSGVTGAPPLASRAYYRSEFARARAALLSARAWFYEAAESAWRVILRGDPLLPALRADIRLSAAHMADVSASTVNALCAISGTAVIFKRHPLQLLRQDAQVPQLHASLGQGIYDAAGAVLLGQAPIVPNFP